MSFSKAKLTRFNEINDCTPSPAHYNPVSNTRTTGINVDKDLSNDGKGDGTNNIRAGSSSSFKVPTPAKKPSKSTSKLPKNDVFEALKEKSIECENKDDVIKQLLDELNNLKDQSGDLQSEKSFVESELKKFQKELDDINESYSVSLTVLNGCFKKDEEDLTQEICDLKVLLAQLHEGQDTMRKAFLMKYEEAERTIEGLSEWFYKTIVPKAPYLDAAEDMIAERDKDLKLLKEKLNAIKIAREITIANLNKSYTLHIEELKVKMKEKIKEIEGKFFSEEVFDVVFNEEVKDDIYNEEESQMVTTVTDSGIDVQSEDVISLKKNKPNLTMYTETYLNDFKPNKDFINPFIIITSPNGDHKYKTGLKMKFYPLKSIEEDSDLSSSEEESTSTSNQSESLTDLYKKTCKKRESKLKKRKNKEIKDLKNLQKIEMDKIEAEEKLKSEQLAEKIREVIRLAGATPEEVAKIVNAKYESTFFQEEWEDSSILTECESIGKYTIHQSEIEKSNLQKEVETIKKELIEEQKPNRMEYINLLKNHEEVVNEYKNFQKQQLNTLIEMNDNISEFKNDNNSYKLTINKVHETIEALTKRLFQSDNDVEQLKSELKQTETTTLELNIKKDKLTEELNNLNKQNEDLRLQKESTSKLFQSEMKQFEENILKTVEEYKNNVNKMLRDYKIKLETNEYDLQEVIKCLYEQEVLNSEAFNLIHLANVEIEDLDKNNRLFKDQICTIKLELEKSKSQIEQINKSKKEINEKLKYEQLKNTQLQEEILKINSQDEIESLNKQINQLKEKNKTYGEYCEYYNQKVKDYEKIINEMDDINRSYIHQTKNYEDLVLKCEEIERKNLELRKILIEKDVIFPIEKLNCYNDEIKGLITQKNVVEDENKLIGVKYMEILDDKNQTGSVKHIVELKEKNFSLLKENQTMESKIQSQSKTIGKLKAELRTFKKTPKKNGKENENEANKENNNSLCETYVSPLRDRNRNE